MARLVVSENVTLDGVVQDPTGEEGSARGGWFARIGAADRDAFGRAALDEARDAGAFLMGRRTYEFLASRWPGRTGPLADRLNSIPKYVVSATLADPAWTNTTVITGDVLAQIGALIRDVRGDLIVPASFDLVRLLLANDLVDELKIMIYPVVLGSGARLFDAVAEPVALRLRESRTLGDHLVQAIYEPER